MAIGPGLASARGTEVLQFPTTMADFLIICVKLQSKNPFIDVISRNTVIC